ncbi:MAG: restriction endonuclease subunit S, partial [Clostridia bacterium]|nr:restriction endonuclease subunit S [Clostridia bacterium]
VKDGKLKAKDIKNDTIIFKGDDNLHYEQFPDGTVKCIEDEIPFDVPDGWVWCRLQTICPYGDCEKVETKDIKPDEWILDLEDIEKDTGNIISVILKKDRNSVSTKHKFYKGQLLYSKLRPYLNKVVIAINDGYCTSEILPLKLFGSINTSYMQIYLMSEVFLSYVNMISYGVKMPRLGTEDGRKALIALPPLMEQYRIVEAFNNIKPIIKSIEVNSIELKDIVGLIKSQILDLAIRGKLVPQNPEDEPASVLLERIRVEKEELIKQGKIKRDKKESVIFKGEDNSYYRTNGKTTEFCDDIPFDLPEGWAWVSLGQYCEKVTDQVASGSFAALRENVVSLKKPSYALMVKTADFSNGFTKNLTYTDKHGYEFLENSNLFGGELILSNIGSIGKVFIVPDLNCKMTLAPNSVMIRLTNNEYRDYLYYFLQSPTGYEKLKAISTGVAMLKFNKTDLKTIYLPSPPLAEQKRIVEAIETAFAQLDEISNSIS